MFAGSVLPVLLNVLKVDNKVTRVLIGVVLVSLLPPLNTSSTTTTTMILFLFKILNKHLSTGHTQKERRQNDATDVIVNFEHILKLLLLFLLSTSVKVFKQKYLTIFHLTYFFLYMILLKLLMKQTCLFENPAALFFRKIWIL